MKKLRVTKKQLGAFSLELALVLLVITALIAGAVLYYRDNLRKISINENVQHLNFIAGNMISKYGKQNLYAQVTTALAVQGRVIPEQLRDGAANTASNPFGAAIVVVPVSLTGVNDAIRLDWLNVSASQCSDIVAGAAGSFRQIAIAGTNVKPLDGQLNQATLEAQCESAGTTGNVATSFWIGRT